MRKLLLAAAAALFILPCSIMAQKTPASLKIMSYNIRYGSADDGSNSWQFRYPASAIMINDQKPDLFGVQEALDYQIAYLKDYCEDYKCIGVGRQDGKKGGEHMSIFYNPKKVSLLKWGTFWLSETPEKPSKGWDSANVRDATWAFFRDKQSGVKFMMVNTHIDHKGAVAQKNGIELVLSKIEELNKDGVPVVMTGDFNMTPDNANIKRVAQVFQNTRDVAALTEQTGTFHGWGRVKDLKKIDYIWIKGFSSCSEFHVVTKQYMERAYVSDHYPVSAEIFF